MHMQAVTDDQRSARAARVIAVLAVLFGLLAMHGIASAHHAQATGPEQGAVAQQHGPEAPSHHEAAKPLIAAQEAGEVAPADLPCDGECPSGLATLCLAIVATAVALALGVSLGRATGRVVVARPAAVVRAPGSARPAPPPPDPVRELCVSRT